MKCETIRCLTAMLIPIGLISGCAGNLTIGLPGTDSTITIPLPGGNVVQVEVFNDTGFDVDPRIRFDDATGFWDQLISSSEELATGILAPGDLVTLNMDCDELGVIYSDTAGQFLGFVTIGQADTTRVLEREDDFDCGDTIQFHFIGEGDGFGVIVSINNVVVD